MADRTRRSLFRAVTGPISILGGTIAAYAKLDWAIVSFLLVAAIVVVPGIPRNSANPQMLAAFVNDEPFMAMGLDGMIVPPFGNPANYLDPKSHNQSKIPSYWGGLRYPGVTYYGGAIFDVAFPFYAFARAIRLPAFPTDPIIMRSVVAIAGALSLLFLYNFGKAFVSRTAGILAAIYLSTDSYLDYYVSIIHPDTLQMYFGLLALGLAHRHSCDGRKASLAALGLMCGFVQGTKFGGPWTVPVALLASFIGLKAAAPGVALSARSLAGRLGILGAAAAIGWLCTNPYAIITRFYIDSFISAFAQVGTADGPFGSVTMRDWLTGLYDHLGPPASFAAIAGLGYGLFGGIATPRRRAWFLAAVLSLSQVVYFGLLGKLWLMIGYLLLGLGLTAVLAFGSLQIVLGWLLLRTVKVSRFSPNAAYSGAVALAVSCAVWFEGTRVFDGVDAVLAWQIQRKSTYFALNDWAIHGGIPPQARILYDDLAYLDPDIYQKARMYGGVLTWSGVKQFDPEYIILSSSLYGSALYAKLIQTQKLAENDPNPFSMRLYQALIPTKQFGPTAASGISYIAKIEADQRWLTAHNIPLPWPFTALGQKVGQTLSYLEAIYGPGDAPLVGTTLKVYKKQSD